VTCHRQIPVIRPAVARSRARWSARRLAWFDDRIQAKAVSNALLSADRTGHRVVVADDDVLLREGVAGLLERSGFEIVGQAGDATELLSLVRAQKPDLAIVDIRMPPRHETEGLDAARVIRRELPGIGIIVLSAHAEVDEAMELLSTGRGVGYVLKTRVTKVEDFIQAVDRVIEGGSVVDPVIVQELVNVRHREDRLERLTEREREVLALMAEGASNAGIAKRLWVTEGTVEKHVRGILSKLRLSETPDDHRRVLAVLTFLDSRG
jgi:serine/threonine-protein kinase PknK